MPVKTKQTTCNVCGKAFNLIVERHYIARDMEKTGMSEFLSHQEVKCYDAFDCPFCGCQVIIQERKREVVDFSKDEIEEIEEEEE